MSASGDLEPVLGPQFDAALEERIQRLCDLGLPKIFASGLQEFADNTTQPDERSLMLSALELLLRARGMSRYPEAPAVPLVANDAEPSGQSSELSVVPEPAALPSPASPAVKEPDSPRPRQREYLPEEWDDQILDICRPHLSEEVLTSLEVLFSSNDVNDADAKPAQQFIAAWMERYAQFRPIKSGGKVTPATWDVLSRLSGYRLQPGAFQHSFERTQQIYYEKFGGLNEYHTMLISIFTTMTEDISREDHPGGSSIPAAQTAPEAVNPAIISTPDSAEIPQLSTMPKAVIVTDESVLDISAVPSGQEERGEDSKPDEPVTPEAVDPAPDSSRVPELPARRLSKANEDGYYSAADIAAMFPPGQITTKRVKRIISAHVNDPKFAGTIIAHTKQDAYGTSAAHYRNTKETAAVDIIKKLVQEDIESGSNTSAP